ncbi:MAG: DUF4265 domain-containing protein [Pseudomonadota bacterium]
MSENAATIELPFLAGLNNDGQPVFESLQAEFLPQDSSRVRLLRSPLFARNLAAGDTLRLINPDAAEYELERRSGNLCVRLFRREGVDEVDNFLTPAIEKLGGERDLGEESAIVYSIHVSIGFNTIEQLFDKACQKFSGTVWYYGNVYDPEDGETPMHWWDEFISQD